MRSGVATSPQASSPVVPAPGHKIAKAGAQTRPGRRLPAPARRRLHWDAAEHCGVSHAIGRYGPPLEHAHAVRRSCKHDNKEDAGT